MVGTSVYRKASQKHPSSQCPLRGLLNFRPRPLAAQVEEKGLGEHGDEEDVADDDLPAGFGALAGRCEAAAADVEAPDERRAACDDKDDEKRRCYG